MSSGSPSRRWAIVYLALFALLFAPASDEGPGDSHVARQAVDPRIIAPTVREGMVARSVKLTTRYLHVTERRVKSDSIPLVVASAVAGLLLVWVVSAAARLWSSIRPHPIARRALVPRAPPVFASI